MGEASWGPEGAGQPAGGLPGPPSAGGDRLFLRLAWRLLRRRLREPGPAELALDAWIIAPHPDDESIACGGTIAHKVELGARVRVLFLTGGSASHDRFLPARELAARRREEALAACRTLRLGPEDAFFLDLPDTGLAAGVEEGAELMAALFRRHPAAEVYFPYHLDPPPDHVAAAAMVRLAAGRAGERPRLLEYPIWFLEHWPWVPAAGPLRERWRAVRRGLPLALRVLQDFRWGVPIGSVRETKWRALACHRTQLEKPPGRPEWPTLREAGHGAFLALFFRSHELFRREG